MGIVFSILKIVGIAAALIIAVLLLLAVLILFVPIFYEAKGSYQEGSPLLEARIRYLFPLLQFRICLGEKKLAQLRVLGILIKDLFAPEKKEKKEKKGRQDQQNKRKKRKKETDKTTSKAQESQESPSESSKNPAKNPSEPVQLPADPDPPNQEDEPKMGLIERIRQLPGKVKALAEALIASCKKLWQKLVDTKDKAQERRDLVLHYIETWQRSDVQKAVGISKKTLLQILKSIRPRKLRVNLHAGLGDPGATGQLCGFYGMLYPFIGKYVIMKPDFERTVYEGDFYCRGRITIFILAKAGCIFLFHRDLKCIRNIILHKEDSNE